MNFNHRSHVRIIFKKVGWWSELTVLFLFQRCWNQQSVFYLQHWMTHQKKAYFFWGWVNSVNTYEITICLRIYSHPLTVTRQLYIHYIYIQLLQSYSTIYSHPLTRYFKVPSGCPGLKSWGVSKSWQLAGKFCAYASHIYANRRTIRIRMVNVYVIYIYI